MTHGSSLPGIAVIGLACRYPEAPNPRQLWENILARRRQFRRIPDCRLSLADYYDADKKVPDKTYGRLAAVIDGFDFDWAGRRIPLSTFRTTDIVHWLALETSLAAVGDAGYTKDTLPGKRTGVIVGNTLTGEQTRANTMRLRWPFVRRALHVAARDQGMDDAQIHQLSTILKDRYTSAFPPVDEDTLAGGLSNTIAGRICNQLDLKGGGFTVDGACASSLLAVAQAAARLCAHDLDLAIVGGVDISLDPFELIGFAKTGALTDGDMTVYDRGGKGFIPGEGCGFMVLKTLAAARRDGDSVYAVIHGWGISSDGGEAGITAPSVSGQALAIERAYLTAPHDIGDLDFIEGHGTGTSVGDRTELEAIARVLGRTPVSRGQLRPCGITSLKSIFGHTKAASGIGGLIKAVMAVNRRIIPPTAACRHPHQAFDSAARRLYPVRQGRRAPADGQLRAGVSSMGFGGINCHITLASGDGPDSRLDTALQETALLAHAQESELLLMGADTRSDMLDKICGLSTTVAGLSIAELADLSAELSRQMKPAAPVRAAIVAGRPDGLLDRLTQLESVLRDLESQSDPVSAMALTPDIWLGEGTPSPRVGFIFPGQGSQQLNMARTLVQRFPWARAWVNQADQITAQAGGLQVSRLIYRDTDRVSGPEEHEGWFDALSLSEHAQPAICLASMLWFEFFTRLGVLPQAVGGHSLGELSAFFAGGVIDADTLLEVAVRRGRVMSGGSGTPGGMVALRCDETNARGLMSQIDGYLTIANRNSPQQTVVSGELKAVENMLRVARENGVGARMLPVSNAFHSRLCHDAARQVGKLRPLAHSMAMPNCPIFSSVDGALLEPGQPLNDHFSRQICSRVDFIDLVTRMSTCCDLMVEMGPGRVLTGLVGDILGEGGPMCLPVESAAGSATDLNRVLGAMFVHGLTIRWDVLYENRLIRPLVSAEQKNFVVNPCETLSAVELLDAGGSLPSDATHTILADAFQGMPKARVNRYLASRGAFLNRVVQADLSFWDPDAQPLEADTKTAALQSDGATGGQSPQTILYRLVSEATGFASETLSRESRLLDDLNLDSIKAGDLIVRFTQTCGVSFPDPALLANATLGELADAAARLEAESANARAASTASRDDLGRQLTGMVSEITGFPEESLDLSMRLLDDLNLDSIKAGDLIARLANQAGLSGEVDAQSLVNASLIQVVDAISDGINDLSMETVKPPDVLAELLDQAARITGFSGEALDPDLPVERDLHLGPDKLEALVKKTTARLGIQAHLDIPPLLTRSLRQISVILQRMIGEQRGSGPDAVVDTTHQATWVRNFSMDLLPAPYPHLPDSWGRRSEDDWEKACVLILHGQDSVDLANVLKAQLFQRGATIQTALIGSDAAAAHVQDSAFSQLVAIMPRNDHREYDRTALLHRLIRRRASVVSPPPAASAPRRRTTVAWIQFGGGCFGREPRFARLDRCATVALGASLHLERKDLRVRVVDFCPTLPAETIARETLAELTTPDSFAAVGYDLDRRRRTLVPRLIQPSTFIKRGISWSTDDVILVTGGAKGITAACAVAVARKTGVRTALVGRTPHPDQAPKTTASREIRSQLDTYAEQGLTADYFSCDVTDRDAVDRLLVAVAERFGPVTGIIHGAGLNRPRLTGQVKPQQAFDETAPKVLGLLHLLDAVRDRPPKLIVGMGSIIGITGMPGNGWYGFSNEVMDIALRGFAGEHPGTQTLNAAYSIWRDAGMGARMGSVDLLREKGIDAIPTDDGVDRFLRLFTHDPGHYQMVVTARMGGLDTWNQKMPEAPQGLRFLENLAHLTPGVEAIFTAHLSLETDPYLSDHHFQGSMLFPTVFGLEAMAQAASWLAGQTAASPLQIKNVRLLRPITVDADSGADIVIRAVLSESANDSETVLRAGILKAGTGIRSDYFTATFIFGGVFDRAAREIIQRPDKPVPLIPETDLYRSSLLFQGPLFQRIQTIWDIRDTGGGTGMALFSSRLAGLDRLTAEAFGQENRTHLCLGDAFFTDTLLQSAALLVPQDTSLPVSIDRVDLLAGFFDTAMSVTVRVELLGQEDRDLIFQVVAVDEAGAVVAALEGYRLRILNHHDTYPTVADLLAPDERDRRLIGQVLDDACRQMSVTPPHLETACIPDIHGQTKAVRRKAERPMLERALSEAARRYDIATAPLSIRWHDSGKPTVAGVSSKDLDVSVTHEDRMCLCACGPGPVGCDLSAISNRSREQWIGLLGDSQADLLDHLIGQGDSLDTAGTRIWAGRETLIKIAGGTDATLRYVKKAGHAVLLVGSDANDSPIHILTVAVRLTWGPPLILASTVVERTVPRVPEHLLTADYPGYEPLYETRPFEMVEGGPQGQLVFVQRLPVTFQPSANLSRTIYFSNFIKWMGDTREASAWPVLAEMSDQFASGRWGGVTNYGHLKILGEGATSDQVEILMWVSNNSGPQNSTMTLSYDFRKMLKGGGYARLAFCRLQTTWVEIVGPGEARVAPYPAYYGQFIEDMCPRFDAPDEPEPMHESLRHLFDGDQDPVIYQAPPGPVVKPIVREQIFETTLAHANLVGNIYYANYYDWQGQIRDRFFYELIPDHYRGIGENGELLALESRVDHLREAMPFDRIQLTLAVKALRSCSVTFHLDYFRLSPDGSRVKIAHGLHRAVWTKRDGKGRPRAALFPDTIRSAFNAAISISGREEKT